MYTHEFEWEDEVTGKLFYVEVDIHIIIDRNFGADADGNRGTEAFFPETEEIRIFLESTLLDEKVHKELYERCEKYFEENEQKAADDAAIEEL